MPSQEIDLHPSGRDDDARRAVTHNVEAEQALLGILLFDNSAFVNIDGEVSARDCCEPFHARLFKAITDLCRVGRLAEPMLLRNMFVIDPAFVQLGGVRYLADMVDRCPPATNARDYAQEIRSTALRRDVIVICTEVANRAAYDPDASGADLMADMERSLLATRKDKADMELRDWSDVSADVIHGLDHPDEIPLLKTGLKKIDDAIGGLERSDLIILGARPSMGKSALAGCIAKNVAMQHMLGTSSVPLGVIELNGEMTTAQMARRHLTDHAFALYGDQGPMYRDIKRKVLTDHQKEILREVNRQMAGLPLKMLKRTGMTIGRMRALLRRQKMLWEAMGIKLSLVIVDHVGLIKPDDAGRGRSEDQTMVSGAMKDMGDELDCVMMGLAQLNRKVEDRDDKRPQLADLRDSGSWEQDADIVIGVYRDAYYARREREPKNQIAVAEWVLRQGSPTVEAIMLKIRESDVATAKLWADIGRNAIRDDEPFSDDGGFDFGRIDFDNAYKR